MGTHVASRGREKLSGRLLLSLGQVASDLTFHGILQLTEKILGSLQVLGVIALQLSFVVPFKRHICGLITSFALILRSSFGVLPANLISMGMVVW